MRRIRPYIILLALSLAGCSSEPAAPERELHPAAGESRASDSGLLAAAAAITPVTSCTVPAPAAKESVNFATRRYYSPGGQAQRLDIAWPRSPGRKPLVVAIHGGGWYEHSRKFMQQEILTLAGQGYVAASLDYRLTTLGGANTFPAAVQDVRCAVRWLRANAGSFDIDPARVAALGYSAGGNLAAMLGTAGNVGSLDGTCPVTGTSPAVDAVLAFYAPLDLRDSDLFTPDLSDIVNDYLGNTPESNPAEAALASPIAHVSSSDAPTLLFHRTRDPLVPVAHSRTMRSALDAAGVPATLVEVSGTQHTFRAFATSSSLRVVPCTTLAFLEQELAP